MINPIALHAGLIPPPPRPEAAPCRLHSADGPEPARHRHPAERKQAILDCLSYGPASVTDISIFCSVDGKSARGILRKLEAQGVVRQGQAGPRAIWKKEI